MEPYYESPEVTLWHGDCLEVLRTLPDASVHAVVTDPPYGLGFMGKEWDKIKQEASRPPSADRVDARFNNAFPRTGKGAAATAFDGIGFGAWCLEWTAECLRVLKPGGHLLAFGGTRTWHRLACAIEDAGFEIRDSIAWMYGSGFPKSLDVSKAINKAAGAEREVVGDKLDRPGYHLHGHNGGEAFGHGLSSSTPETRLASALITAPATEAARTWQGWGTALKPAFEPIVVARKPLTGTVAGNVLAHGTGALNIDACRVESSETWIGSNEPSTSANGYGPGDADGWQGRWTKRSQSHASGRWPANVILDEDQAAALDEQSGESQARIGKPQGSAPGDGWGMTATGTEYDDLGGASRFFYVAKADASERPKVGGVAHPTVKPLTLMRWLVRLVTPPGGVVLEPFAGSGTTVEACLLEGFRCVAIEKTEEYLPLIEARVHRRRDPVAAARLAATGDDEASLFDLLNEEGA